MIDLDPALFEKRRRFLLGLAYRILGSLAEAEDAVQDTFLRWREADRDAIESPAAWLTATCTRRCIDVLRSAQRTRVEYVGTWLPEPVCTMSQHTPDDSLELASSLSTAFLLLLERLTPKERAAYLLHEIFGLAYPDLASALGLQEAACRKLVSRARAAVGQAKTRWSAPLQRQEELLSAFQQALASGRMEPFSALLSDDIELCADSGGKVPALLETLRGKPTVLDFVSGSLRKYWSGCEWRPADLSGGRGVLLVADGHVAACVTFAYDEAGRVTNIYIMRNPDKLGRLGAVEPPAS